MALIDFAFGAPDRLRMTCEVIRKHYLSGREIVVYTRDRKLLERFDLLLWGFDATAFIPHVLSTDSLAERTPVLLTPQLPLPPDSDRPEQNAWLINLDTQCPPNPEQFERILEIVSNDDDEKESARERWRQYKAQGHTLRAHDVGGQIKA